MKNLIRRIIKEELNNTSWETEDGKVTLTDLLDATKDIPVKNIPLEKLKPFLLKWDGDEKELIRVDKVDLTYPILVFVKGNKFLTIIDGNHRVHKAIKQGEKEIKGKLIQIDELPEDIRKVFKHIG
jgi:hypothetical protein